MSPELRTIVIVGAGFSGTAVAINLLRLKHEQPLRIILIDRSQMARGVPYNKLRYPYLLNVPAGRMSANSDDPLEFLRFARRWQPAATADDFLPRELYGEYLECSLRSAEDASAPEVELQRTYGLVIAIERIHRASTLQVHLADGRKLKANDVVLALGNPPPAPLPGSDSLRGSARYVADPWQAPPSFRAGETVLIAGTGLTMADTVIAGCTGHRRKVAIHAISRHGLLPTPQTSFHSVKDERSTLLFMRSASASLLRLFRSVRTLSEEIESRGGDWREAIAFVRDLAPALWERLPIRERRRFLRHIRPYWDVHRHRLPNAIWSALNDLRRDGQLNIHAGRILGLERVDKQIQVTFRARGRVAATSLLVDRVINCTGADYDVRHTQQRLLRSLLAQGVATRDPLGLGIATDEMGALITASGYPAANIYYIGPMLRAAHWETTAVTELREHAARLARHLVDLEDDWTTRPGITGHPLQEPRPQV